MTTQTTDQGLVIPDYPEVANGPAAINGLVTGGLESRLVKRYASAGDRTTRNPNPQTGELSWRPSLYEFFTGSVWVPFPGVCIARGSRTTDKSGIDGTERGILRVDSITIISGRRYWVTGKASRFSPATSTDICRHRFRYSEAGAATTGSTALAYGEIEGSKSVTLDGGFTASTSSTTASVIFTGQRATGVSATSWLGTDDGNWGFEVFDMGVDPGNTGVVL